MQTVCVWAASAKWPIFLFLRVKMIFCKQWVSKFLFATIIGPLFEAWTQRKWQWRKVMNRAWKTLDFRLNKGYLVRYKQFLKIPSSNALIEFPILTEKFVTFVLRADVFCSKRKSFVIRSLARKCLIFSQNLSMTSTTVLSTNCYWSSIQYVQ